MSLLLIKLNYFFKKFIKILKNFFNYFITYFNFIIFLYNFKKLQKNVYFKLCIKILEL